MDTANKPKVIVIGLDGATFRNLKPWMEQGLLPNLKFLVDNGASGELESTIPRQSAPAWTSFMTGVNPGKHGIFGFIKPFKDSQYKREMVSSEDIKSKTIFEMLSDYNKTSGTINLPITYPPFKINGFMIGCGLLTPSKEFKFTYPDNLFEKNGIKKEEYVLDVDWFDYSENEKLRFFFDLMECEEKRQEASLKLINQYNWDLFVIVFTGMDRIHHYCWHYIDNSHPKYNPEEAKKFLPLIIKYYQKIDSAIGKFLKFINENTSLLIISDHGFGPREKKFSFHKLLEHNKMLHYKRIYFLEKNYERFIYFIKNIRGFLHKNPPLYKALKIVIKSLNFKKNGAFKNHDAKATKKKIFRSDVDSRYWKKVNWKRTFCYAGYTDNTVYLNLKSREPEGIVDSNGEYRKTEEKIANLLENLYDPEKRRKLDVKIYKNGDIYSGPFSRDGCNLYIEIENERYLLRSGAYSNSKSMFEESTGWSGSHTKDGIIICYGNNFKKSYSIDNAQIIDLAPTILYLLGLPISNYLDGKVLKTAISDEHLVKNPIQKIESSEKDSIIWRKNNREDSEDKSKVEKRLADLGYI